MYYPIWCSLCILVFALVLSFLKIQYESFIGSPDAKRCGLNEMPCNFGQSCLNGWCVDSSPPSLPTTTGLPVLP